MTEPSAPDDLTPVEAELLEKADAFVWAMVAEGLELADARTLFVQQAMAAIDGQIEETARCAFALPAERDGVQRRLLKALAKVWDDDE